MTKVYIPSVPTRYDPASSSRISAVDLNPATKFGELDILVPLDGTRDIHEEIGIIRDGLSEIKRGDFIVAVGDPILIAAAIAYACDMLGEVRVLRWDRISKRYSVLEVVL